MARVVPTEQIVVRDEQSHLQRVFNLFKEFDGFIDIGQSDQVATIGSNLYTGNLNGQGSNVTAPAGANTEFAVSHSLVDSHGNPKVPSFYFYISDRSANVYQLPNTGTPWTKTQVFLKCDTASAVLRIFIL